MFFRISFFNPIHRDVITAPSCINKILKIPVFRLSLGDDLVSRIVIFTHNFSQDFLKRGLIPFAISIQK